MLRRTRVVRGLDVGRLGASLARPGMDTRVWVSLACALGESNVDAKYGVYVDVRLLPTGERYTARVPADYAGKGFGFYSRIHKDDDLVLVIPSGDPAEGPVVLARLWSEADTPPQEAVDDQDEVMLVLEKDKNLRIKVSGGGLIQIEGEKDVTVQAGERAILKSDKVRLGDGDATEQAILGTTFRSNQKTMDQGLYGYLAAMGGFLTTAGNDPTLVGLASAAAAALASAGAQATLAANVVNIFESGAGANDYLSQVTNTK